MQRVMGGEFLISQSLMEHVQAVDKSLFATGRGALRGIIRAIRKNHDIQCMSVPNYICDSVTQALQQEQVPYEFYEVGTDLYPSAEPTGDVVLLVNYFGMVDVSAWIERIKQTNPETIVIVDNVQNYYGQDILNADYLFNSFRKWFPLPDGAEVIAHGTPVEIPTMEEANHFAALKIAGNYLKNYSVDIPESIALQLIQSGEEQLDTTDAIIGCSAFTAANCKVLDYEVIAGRRKANAAYIHERLQTLGISHIWNDWGTPLFVPVFLPHHRDEVRRKMFAHQIFTPIHWPWVSEALNGKNELYETELSLICDQRYDL